MDSEEIINQICVIKEKYESQVTGDHKQWPRAIKERVLELYKMGVKVKVISERTGISYHTVASWTARASKFKELPVQSMTKKLVVTNPIVRPLGRPKTKTEERRNGTVTIRTLDGITVEGLSFSELILFFNKLRSP
jgi:hypothetical protein